MCVLYICTYKCKICIVFVLAFVVMNIVAINIVAIILFPIA